MSTLRFRDIERLSAYLDGELAQAEKTRLEARLQSDPALAAALDELRQARTLLRRTPKRRAPRNFMLTPKMAGIKPPVPRLVPALSWASAVAMLLFAITFGSGLIGQFSFGAGAPMMAAAPNDARGIGGGPPVATEAPFSANVEGTSTPEAYTLTAPQATQPPADQTAMAAPTAEASVMTAPQAPPSSETMPKVQTWPVIPWPFAWLGLAVLLIGAALLVRWRRERAFQRKFKS